MRDSIDEKDIKLRIEELEKQLYSLENEWEEDHLYDAKNNSIATHDVHKEIAALKLSLAEGELSKSKIKTYNLIPFNIVMIEGGLYF